MDTTNINIKTGKILSYDEVAAFPAGDSDESLVDVRSFDGAIRAEYAKQDMIAYTGQTIYVRQSLAELLAAVNSGLSETGYRLKVVYGYRHPEIQQKYFVARRAALQLDHPALDPEDLDRLTHNHVAVPSVAGHPAAAAVDVTLIDFNDQPIDMGSEIADYSDPEKVVTHAKGLTEVQVANRKLLHDAMVGQGFAPFYGEWWHFSYGDREWAAFYNKEALFGPVDFKR